MKQPSEAGKALSGTDRNCRHSRSKTAAGRHAAGQLFSVDFVIATAIAVLCLGVVLSQFDLVSAQSKEARLISEATSVAAVASAILLEKHPCSLNSTTGEAGFRFSEEGYSLTNCSSLTTSAVNANTKALIMVPSGLNCHVEVDGANADIGGCATQVPPSSAGNVVSIERRFLGKSDTITKAVHEKCVNSTSDCSGIYTAKTLRVMIWG